ncbi:DgyrCDS11842 [Dimorphilus gyrociliatus]|uniref:DgyrCDS11842 n=1 Tax=Dimorphilus gyrociliatus TaxID=2664684 RepID=A0A7I8W4N7_9ANNE|nr:DgyrCDS11842 [Dimorphilus gyrociliatus]
MQQDRTIYEEFISQISDPDLEATKVEQLLLEVSQNATKLTSRNVENCKDLIYRILRLKWTNLDQNIANAYIQFANLLASSHPEFETDIIEANIKSFLITGASEEVAQNRIHDLLLNLSSKNGLSNTEEKITQAITRYFPHMTKSVEQHENFTKHVLKCSTYLASVREYLLEVIIDRMLKLDARASREAILEAEENMEESCTFTMETEKNELAHKEGARLDCMMDIFFTYLHDICHPEGDLDFAVAKVIYKDLLFVFDRLILKMWKICHVPFVIFYLCSFKDLLAEDFLDYLWKKVCSPQIETVFRQASASYIASFLARAKYVSTKTCCNMLSLLAEWLHNYQLESNEPEFDLHKHATYYSVAQALFYTFTFRHIELCKSPSARSWIHSLRLQALVTSRLNPLKACLPTVVNTFSSVAHQQQIVLCDSIIERNARSSLPVVSSKFSDGWLFTKSNPLDAFFPFDPYVLNRSKLRINGIYREYEGQPVVIKERESTEAIEESWESFKASLSPMYCSTSPGYLNSIEN